VLITVIVTMITVSLQPLSPKKILALIAALIGLSTVSCFADSVFLSVNSTPYDRQMTRIQPVLFTKASEHKENVSLGLVNHWMQDLRGIPYGFSAEWKTPAEVESAAFADCKGKAVALYEKMHSCGAQNVRLVIGRRALTSRKTHAWLEWTTESGNYLLDPTLNWTAYRSADVGNHSYIPLYAYAGSRKYRAASGTLLAKN
jgi:predicted transglutaminase-like cysteine proteinase